MKVYEIIDRNTLDIIFNGENMLPENYDINDYKKISILKTGNHFDVITNLLSCVSLWKYCESCNISFNKIYHHICKNKCKLCYASPPCNLGNDEVKCTGCSRYFLGEKCLEYNKYANS